MPPPRHSSLLIAAALCLARSLAGGPCARADAPGDTLLPDLGVALKLGADWRVAKSYGPAGLVIRNASREFAPLEIVAWPAPAKAASAQDAVSGHEALLRERFKYERLSAIEVRAPADPHALQVTGAVTGNDGVRYAALFAAYFIGDRYLILGTFCKPDSLGHVRRAFFDAASASLRPKRADVPPVAIAAGPPTETAPVAGGRNGRPMRGGLTPIIKALAPPEASLTVGEGQPVAAKTPMWPRAAGKSLLGTGEPPLLTGPGSGALSVSGDGDAPSARGLTAQPGSAVSTAKLLPPDIGGVATPAGAAPATPGGDEGVAGGPVAAAAGEPPATGPAGTAAPAALGPGTGLTVSGDTSPVAPGTAAAGLGKPLPPDVSAMPPPGATTSRATPNPTGEAVTIASVAASPPAAALTWRAYANPYGFGMSLPPEWRVELARGFIVVAGPAATGRATVALCPVWMGPSAADDLAAAARRALQRWTEAAQSSAEGAAIRWAEASADPLSGLSPASLSGVQMGATGDEGGVPMRLTATLVCQGSVGLLTIMQDEASRFDASAPVLRRIAASFSGGAFALPPEAAPAGTRYTDATEGAFEVRLPAGWQATGGLKRYNGTLTLDLRLRSEAPGGPVCEWRQPFTPAFREFTPFLKGLGWHERDLYSPDAHSAKLVVLKSRPPDDFLRTYLLPGGALQPVQVVATVPNATAAALLPAAKADAAQVIVRGGAANAARERAYLMAIGEAPGDDGNACWQAAYLMAEGAAGSDPQPSGPSKPTADALVALSTVIASATLCGDWRGTDEERAALTALLGGARKATQALVPPESQGPIALLGTEPPLLDAPKVAVPAALTKVHQE